MKSLRPINRKLGTTLVASVATAISIRRALPMYLGLTWKPFGSLAPSR